ncbi:MAG: Thiamine pyrophosphokinase [Firmicutes bacterium ADurb.Bin153]|nr:MAG: Thiamine pyrophosphokinase [Firmicutes bacterium ADurb.Bin153]
MAALSIEVIAVSTDEKMSCIVFAGCEDDLSFPGEEIRKRSDIVICADRGLRFCYMAGMKADIALGDFDSVTDQEMDRARAEGTRIFEYPSEKDETDLDLALKLAFRLGSRRCFLYGALGGRIDHELANILLMRRYASMGMQITMMGKANTVEILTHDFPCYLAGREACTISIIPLSDTVIGIKTSGMKFELHGEDLSCGSSRGVSNQVIGELAEISCDSGEAAVVINAKATRLD